MAYKCIKYIFNNCKYSNLYFALNNIIRRFYREVFFCIYSDLSIYDNDMQFEFTPA